MSYKSVNEAVVWTFYGSGTMLEPPDRELAHRKCWKRITEEERKLIREISWLKPVSLGVLQ